MSKKIWKMPDDNLSDYRGPVPFEALAKLSIAEDLTRIADALEKLAQSSNNIEGWLDNIHARLDESGGD